MTVKVRLGVLLSALALTAGTACSGGGSSDSTQRPDQAAAATTDGGGEVGGGGGPLSAAPRELTYSAPGGPELTAVYYPAAKNPAPMVVFFHWVSGDKSDWFEVAPWLQNRSFDNQFRNPGPDPWWDPSWFPKIDGDVSYGVLIVSLRGCTPFPDGCVEIDEPGWLADATAALQFAATLDGVDRSRIAAVGSSIGADAAADACAAVNVLRLGSCDGAFSLSPGDYLGLPYPEVIAEMGATPPPVPAWCLAADYEFEVCSAAEASGNLLFRAIEVTEGAHGNMLITPDADPVALQLLLDFLAQLFPG